jgi:hypothetical protein
MTRRSVYVRFAAPQVGKALFDQEDCIVDQISGLGFYDPAQLGGILALGKDDWQYLASQSWQKLPVFRKIVFTLVKSTLMRHKIGFDWARELPLTRSDQKSEPSFNLRDPIASYGDAIDGWKILRGREPVCGSMQGLREDPLDVQIESNIEQNGDGK